MKKNKEIEKIKKKIIPVLKEFKVTKAGIFGSYARGEQKKNSDLDILIKIHNDAGLLTLIGLKLELQKVIKRKVDLVEYETIRKEVRENMLNDEIKIL
ncbi:nucleotidyltransferase domain-containing protein [Candidatus Pacearchaeota archaeon]|nr:nucleotidyltransferase domain-containing protein [Candidatus Pacearchaeota archaeon]